MKAQKIQGSTTFAEIDGHIKAVWKYPAQKFKSKSTAKKMARIEAELTHAKEIL